MTSTSVEKAEYNIGIVGYEGVDLLDVAAPYEMFNWMAQIEGDEGKKKSNH